ncbi:MAG: hypothetical protein DMG76_03280 [Acidobacteria bacterium]|jgi:DNA-binding NarL/FixJ family response regulator|nr:MAG: hypothetical protein DMG76_03280 [Acidobacteriota bacterium]
MIRVDFVYAALYKKNLDLLSPTSPPVGQRNPTLAEVQRRSVSLFFATQGGVEVQSTQPLYRTIRVLVADSSPITSHLLAEAVGRHRGIEILAFGSDPEKLFSGILKSMPDVALISAWLGDDPNGGLQLLRRLRVERPSLKSVILLDSQRPDTVVHAFRSGASGVFGKNLPINMLCKCIRAVHDGQIWANSEELGYIVAALSATPRLQIVETRGLALLCKREQEVVQSLAEGLTNRQIADRLKISPHTVKNYMFKIFDKLGVSTRLELIFLFLSRSGDASQTVPGLREFQPDKKQATNRKQPNPETVVQIPRRLPQYELESRLESRKDQPAIGTSLSNLA